MHNFEHSQEIEVDVHGGFYSGTVYYDLEVVDNSFDYEYGSEKGVHKDIETHVADWNLSQLKYYNYESEEPIKIIPTEDDLEAIKKEILKNA
jgi:hypothetical protein